MDENERKEAPEELTDAVSGGEVGGNPTVPGLTEGGMGTEIGAGYPEAGGPHGSGGGVVKRAQNPEVVGGVSNGGVGGTSVGAGIPGKRPEEEAEGEERSHDQR